MEEEKLTENGLEVSGYLIKMGKKEQYKFLQLPEELCKLMCNIEDQGKQHSGSSRYLYTVDGYEGYKGFRFGTAKSVIQTIIRDQFKKPFQKFSIIPINQKKMTE